MNEATVVLLVLSTLFSGASLFASCVCLVKLLSHASVKQEFYFEDNGLSLAEEDGKGSTPSEDDPDWWKKG